MKAKHFKFDKRQEIVLDNGERFSPKAKETEAKFVARVTEYVEEEHVEVLELKEVTEKTIKTLSTKVVQSYLPKAEGLYKDMLTSLLESRGVKVETKKQPAKKETTKKDSPKKSTQKSEKELSERQKAIEAFKKTKTYKDPLKNVGEACSYTIRKHKKQQTGVVKGLSINKTLTKVYYVILNDKTNERESCAIQNATF